MKFPESVARQYTADLEKWMLELREFEKKELYPILKVELVGYGKSNDFVSHDGIFTNIIGVLAKYQEKVKRALFGEKLEEPVKKMVRGTNKVSESQHRLYAKKEKVKPGIFRREKWLEPFVKEQVELNSSRIVSIHKQHISDVEKVLFDSINSGLRTKEISKKIDERWEVGRFSSSKKIARDQIGSVYSSINKERQVNNGIDSYIWMTTKLDRVRPDHQKLHRKKCSWDKPQKIRGRLVHPGEDYNCECTAKPVFPDLLKGE